MTISKSAIVAGLVLFNVLVGCFDQHLECDGQLWHTAVQLPVERDV